jgi:parvulin-like peptidyl-prolyl isomerase
MLDPTTREPTPRDQLKPLDLAPEDLDKILYQMQMGDEQVTMTVGDYKIQFDRANVFERPKKDEMLGGLRKKIYEAIDKGLVIQEAKERGYFEDSRVSKEVDTKIEEMMVTKLFAEAIAYDKEVTPEQLAEFWEEHKSEYFVAEGRSGRIVYCESEESARAAEIVAREHDDWAEVLDLHGTDEMNMSQGGETRVFRADIVDPVKDALFMLPAIGDVSEPINLGDRWAVVRLETVEPGYQKELAEVTEELGQRMRMIRQDQALRDLLTEWRSDFGTVIHDEALAKVRSWEELSTVGGA